MFLIILSCRYLPGLVHTRTVYLLSGGSVYLLPDSYTIGAQTSSSASQTTSTDEEQDSKKPDSVRPSRTLSCTSQRTALDGGHGLVQVSC